MHMNDPLQPLVSHLHYSNLPDTERYSASHRYLDLDILGISHSDSQINISETPNSRYL